ncbi:MAG TPA: hypothetical protein VG186_13250 [Solirubrobacteraceae bacterium]|jgi:hypothetical protein|nr:hypothetical protein [Solirubrobacteraceae bacterium]
MYHVEVAPFEALTDYLLALRALLEPEGMSSLDVLGIEQPAAMTGRSLIVRR